MFGVLRLQKFDFLDHLREEIYDAIKATVKQVKEKETMIEYEHYLFSIIVVRDKSVRGRDVDTVSFLCSSPEHLRC